MRTLYNQSQVFSDSLAGQNANHIVQLVRFNTHRTVVKIWISFLQHTEKQM